MAKVLLTGAAGYIRGTVLDHLVRSEEPSLKLLTIDVMIRDNKATEILQKPYGSRVGPILWTGSMGIPFVADTAANYDIIINIGTGFIAEGAKALVYGLARRTSPVLPVPGLGLHRSALHALRRPA